MDMFQHRYYRLNKIMMTLIGQWPYQRTHTRHAVSGFLIFVGTFDMLSRILAIVKYRDDWEIVMDCTVPILLNTLCVTKLIGFMNNSQNTLQLLNRIHTDWQVWAQHEEISILHAYSKQGKHIATLYTAVMFSTGIIFMAVPVAPKIIDVLLRNGTEVGKFPFPAIYYRLDEQKYYFYIIMYCYVCEFSMMLVIITNEVMLISYVYHGSGIFVALGQKLERIGNDNTLVEKGRNPSARHERDMLYIASCINRHNDAIKYVNLIDAAYSWTFLVSFGFAMLLINITGLEIVRRKNDPEDFTRFTAMACGVMLNFYTDCYFSQILIDRSISVHFSIYNNQWYNVSVKMQRLLQFMSMRSRVPCELTAGKMFIMGRRTYVLTVRTIMSYFTFARSLEGI